MEKQLSYRVTNRCFNQLQDLLAEKLKQQPSSRAMRIDIILHSSHQNCIYVGGTVAIFGLVFEEVVYYKSDLKIGSTFKLLVRMRNV